jgi:hypothetical protein
MAQLLEVPSISNNKRGVQSHGWDFLPNIQRPWCQYFILEEGRGGEEEEVEEEP